MIRLHPELVNRANEGLDGLKAALQSAIELEHATLPPYLYALYSIKEGTNQHLAKMIHSVVLEEMLHLALCCNLLNAIGGAPSLNHPDFLPRYPSPLPGAVAEIEVPLAPLSKSLIHDVFMEIEEPEEPLIFPVEPLTRMDAVLRPQTIGQFYQTIKSQMTTLSREGPTFTGNPSRQLGTGLPGILRVTDLPSAIKAIDLIVEQGEGTAMSPLNAVENPAHYYLFASAYHGRQLVSREGDPPFAYAGDEIAFDEGRIKRLIVNPTPEQYIGTAAMAPNEQFNKTYTTLLEALHKTFNGSPRSIFGTISLMLQLKSEALELTRIALGNGLFAGPTFTYTPPRSSLRGNIS